MPTVALAALAALGSGAHFGKMRRWLHICGLTYGVVQRDQARQCYFMTSNDSTSSWAAFARRLGDNLGRLREERGFSQEQTIARAGISRQTYQRIERGALPLNKVANPTLSTLLAICSALDVDINEVIPPFDKEMFLSHAMSEGKNFRGQREDRLPPQPSEAADRSVEARRVLEPRVHNQSRGSVSRAVDSSRQVRDLRGSKTQESGPWHEKYGVRFQQ